MRILFFSHYFPPEVNAPAVRTFEHCRQWARLGHDVHVVTCVPNHPQGRVYSGYTSCRSVQHEKTEGVHVHRVWTYIAANRGFLRRTLGYVSYMLSAVLASMRLPRPDVIVATSPQFFCACAGFLASHLLRRPWVFELRDLWPESIIAVGAMRNRTAIRLLEHAELRLYRDAAHVVAVTDAFRQNLARRGIPENKISVVPNGVDVDQWRQTSPAATRQEVGLDGAFIVSYVGTHGMAHNLETMLDAAHILLDEPEIKFVTVGEGAEFEHLQRLRRERDLRNVNMVGQVAHDKARAYLLASDVSLVLLRKTELFRAVLPSKMFEAMAAGKPIILGVEGEAQRLVEETQAGICVEPENGRALADAILRLKQDKALRHRLGGNGRRAVEERFDRRILAMRTLDKVAGLSRPRPVRPLTRNLDLNR